MGLPGSSWPDLTRAETVVAAKIRLMLTRDGWQTISDALQIAFDGLQIRKSILERLLGCGRSRRFVLGAVRDDGANSDVGALIGVPSRRSLHESDGVSEVGLPSEEVANGVSLARHVSLTGNWHALVLQRIDECPVDDISRRRVCCRRCWLGSRTRRRNYRRLHRVGSRSRRRDFRRQRRWVWVADREHHHYCSGDRSQRKWQRRNEAGAAQRTLTSIRHGAFGFVLRPVGGDNLGLNRLNGVAFKDLWAMAEALVKKCVELATGELAAVPSH